MAKSSLRGTMCAHVPIGININICLGATEIGQMNIDTKFNQSDIILEIVLKIYKNTVYKLKFRRKQK